MVLVGMILLWPSRKNLSISRRVNALGMLPQLSLGFRMRLNFQENIHELIFKPRVFSCFVEGAEVCFFPPGAPAR